MQGSIPIQQVAIIILHFRGVCQVYFSHTSCAVYIPQTKAWGFDRRALKCLIYIMWSACGSAPAEKSGGFSISVISVSVVKSNPAILQAF